MPRSVAARRYGEPSGFQYDGVIFVSSMDDVPERLERAIYVVTRSKKNRWAILLCPCGCGHTIQVNLMRSHYPYWRLKRHVKSISLSPSLWVSQRKCGSHFWIIRNRVYWSVENSSIEDI